MIYKAPQNTVKNPQSNKAVFLAGSIEMGKAVDWQTQMADLFDKRGWDVFNPRRDDWDTSWVQEYENPQFYQQVKWELNALEQAELIIMYFDPATKSPISLLELGLYADKGKLLVVCPEGFWRKGNVEIVCDTYCVPFFDNLDDLKVYLAGKI